MKLLRILSKRNRFLMATSQQVDWAEAGVDAVGSVAATRRDDRLFLRGDLRSGKIYLFLRFCTAHATIADELAIFPLDQVVVTL